MADKAGKNRMNNLARHDAPPPKARTPDWAGGLRRLYDSVVEEPLPESFARLLEELDKGEHD